MTHSLIILGTGGGVHDVLDAVEAINARCPTWSLAGFLDDSRPVGSQHLGLPVLGRVAEAHRFDGCFINAIGSDRSHGRRPGIVMDTGLPPARFASIVHPRASVSSHARLGRGALVAFNVSVGGGASIGDHVALCPGVIIGHDTTIEDHALVAPGAIVSGHVRLGQASYVGAGAVIRQNLSIGAGALVGMGAVVTRSVPDCSVVVGNPARLREHETTTVRPT